ncbi:hypothetical protein B9Z55_012595 [Caenorhabditis nigoni]|uniref:Uncharacterized protein n=1 Tax=Caenorhabditis nigoni TaxID=1611254 RepID=A0A2G5TZ01_9PELO|nr:hypothetical protein B9Z55_012595 [Caenorhabditis nigoni]
MLLFISILLCIPSILTLPDSIHNTTDTADLYPMVWQDEFDKNLVTFNVYNNFKTGENTSRPAGSCRYKYQGLYYPGLYWETSYRREDKYPGENAVACAYRDVDPYQAFLKKEFVSDQSRLEVGESKMSGNGTTRVNCDKFDGHVRRVSEAFSGCYYNGTVYQIHEEWEEPNPGNDSSLWKLMSCQRMLTSRRAKLYIYR